MGLTVLGQGQGKGQKAGIPDFQPIREQHHLDASGAGVIPVRDGIDDGLCHHFPGDLVGHGRLRATLPGPNPQVDLGHDEVHGLVHQVEYRVG